MISILIRNKNEAKSLEKTLKGIYAQHSNIPFEIVVIDDSSTDDSVAIASIYSCKVVRLAKSFTYGYAINFGVQQCQYGIILLLSSHNILISTDFLDKLVTYFDDSKVAAVRCTPVANIKQVEQSLINELIINKDNYSRKNDWENLLIANCSAIRKEVAVKIPFNETIRSNEEKLWSLDVMEDGFNIFSNVPCYFLYNKKNVNAALIRDITSKFQIDGIKPISLPSYLMKLFKSIPWAFKIALQIWYDNVKINTLSLWVSFKHKKGLYK